jgi:Flp pilus assembly protein TadD
MAEPRQSKKNIRKSRHILKRSDTLPNHKKSTEPEIAQTSPRRILYVSLLIFSVALFVRLLYLYESSDNPTFEAPIVDAQGYDQLARLLVGSKVMPKEFFWRGFFYPFFLSGVYLFSGSSIVFAKIVQVILGSFTCVLVYKVGEKIFGYKTGMLAGAIAAFYGPLIFYDGELLSTGWEAFWSVALVLLFLKAASVKGQWFYFVLGLCGGLSAITRIVFLPFLIVGCLWLVIVLRRSAVGWRFINGAVLITTAGFSIITGPVAIQNFRVTGMFSIQPSNGSLNLYLGNNPDTCATLTARPGPDYSAIMNLPKQHGIEDIRGQQKFFYDKVISYALAQPLSFLKGLAYKTLQFTNSREIPNTYKLYTFRKWSLVLRVLTWKIGKFGFPFGLLLPLGVFGLVLNRWQQVVPLAAFLLLYSLSIILVHVNDRYRLPIIPGMCVLGACGLLTTIKTLRLKQWRRLIVILAASAATVLAATLPGPFCLEKLNYEPELYYGVGNYRQMQGRTDEAIANYFKALELKNDYSEAHNNLAATFLQQGKTDKAIAHYVEAVRLKPSCGQWHKNLADAMLQQENIAEASKEYERAIQLNPSLAGAHKNLGDILIRQGKISQAIKHYRRALQIEPDTPALLNNLAWILSTSKNETIRNADEAVLLAERACELVDYKKAPMLDTLAAAYAAAGRFPEAVTTGQKALELALLSGQKEVAENIRSNLELYKANRAIHTGP